MSMLVAPLAGAWSDRVALAALAALVIPGRRSGGGGRRSPPSSRGA